MIFLTLLPEIVAFLQFILVSVQEVPIGPVLVAVQIAMFALLAATHPMSFMTTMARWWPLLAVQILALISTTWSPLPAFTARYASQYLFTAVFAVFLARMLGPRRFLIILTASTFIFCVLCVLYGRQGASFHGNVLIGLTGSKNQLGYEAQVLFVGALAVLMLRDIGPLTRWFALLSIPLSAWLLIATQSSTALVTAVVGAVMLYAMAMMQRLQPGGRFAMFIAMALIAAPLTLALPEIHAALDHFVFDTLAKDPTLTGRTLLWARADDLIAHRPVFGYGYQAIWMGDSTETIALRRLTNIEDSRVFHFHHQFRQIAVDTGFVGVAAFIGILIAAGFAHVRRFLLQPTIPLAFFFIIFVIMFGRAFVDVILGPFSIHTFLFYAACVFALRGETEAVRQVRLAPGWQRSRFGAASAD